MCVCGGWRATEDSRPTPRQNVHEKKTVHSTGGSLFLPHSNNWFFTFANKTAITHLHSSRVHKMILVRMLAYYFTPLLVKSTKSNEKEKEGKSFTNKLNVASHKIHLEKCECFDGKIRKLATFDSEF